MGHGYLDPKEWTPARAKKAQEWTERYLLGAVVRHAQVETAAERVRRQTADQYARAAKLARWHPFGREE